MAANFGTKDRDGFDYELLIAGARTVLASFAVVALYLDRTRAESYETLVWSVAVAYLAYSALIMVAARQRPAVIARRGLLCHVLDLAVFCVLTFATDATSSPFFVFFVFALVAAAIRWQRRGTLITAAILLGAFLLLGGYSGGIAKDPDFELDRFVLRSAYLAVVAVLLGYLGDHETRLRARTAEIATVKERIRLARDLHDGAIQSLTGAALKLQVARNQAPEPTQAALDEVLQLLGEEQRELRRFAAGADGGEGSEAGDGLSRLRELPLKFERQWGMRVEMEARVEHVPESAEALIDAYWLIREALVNGVRHGAAQSARVELVRVGDALEITVDDDGGGLPFHGEYDLTELDRRDIGPRSIRQRVAACGGALRLISGERGTRVEIRLPLVRTRR